MMISGNTCIIRNRIFTYWINIDVRHMCTNFQAKSDSKKTTAILSDNYISNNHCHGICVKKDQEIFAACCDPEHGIKLEMTNNVFEENIHGDIGHFLVNKD